MNSQQEDHITYFARTNFRSPGVRFGIRRADRRAHMYIIGKSGTGKSTLLKTLILQDLQAGGGLALLDPHGDLVEEIAGRIPPERQGDTLYLNLPDPVQPLRFNPFSGVPPAKRPLAAAGLVEVFKKMWADSWGPRLEHLLRNVVYALLDAPGATLADVPRLLKNKEFRARVVDSVSNAQVRSFWRSEYEEYSPSLRAQVIAPLQNKVGAFLSDPILYRFLSAPRSSFDLRELMDRRGILLVNLSKGKLGDGPASLIGALLMASIGLSGLSRADTPISERKDFYVYLDEFHTVSTPSLASMLAELRKYRVNLILAHQHLSQLEEGVRDAIFGNVGTLVSFRVGAIDARLLARELFPEILASDLTNLPNCSVCLKLMICGVLSKPFSASTVSSV